MSFLFRFLSIIPNDVILLNSFPSVIPMLQLPFGSVQLVLQLSVLSHSRSNTAIGFHSCGYVPFALCSIWST